MLTLYLILILILIVVYFKLITPLLYWKKRDIFYVKPWSRIRKIYLGKKSIAESVIDLYKDYPDKRYYGSYQFLEPSIFIRDVDLAKQIAVKDFEYFTDHRLLTNEKTDPVLGLNLFSLKGKRWREMRSTLSPAFTSSKMKIMYTLISDTADNFINHFSTEEFGQNTIELEMRDSFSRFTNDVIATCAFGVNCNSLTEPKNDFFSKGEMFMSTSPWRILRFILGAFFPRILEFFQIPALDNQILAFFSHLIKDSINQRESQQIIRPDLIHLLMEARKGRLKPENNETNENDGFATAQESEVDKKSQEYAIDISDDVITGQALVFFIAGFATSSSTLSFMSYELAVNPEIQQKLQEEIDDVVKKHQSDNIPYDELLQMKYLDQIVSETLRKYPPGYVINRICVKDYLIEPKLDDEKPVKIEKGCLVAIPAIAFHYSPEYFPEPYRFNPDRFSDENKTRILSGTYMPFGMGPRNCIGSRFGLLQIKTLMFKLLANFDVVPVKRTVIPLQLAKTFDLKVKGGNWLGLKRRKRNLS